MAATDDIQAPTRQSAPAVEAPAPPAASTPAWGEEAPSTSAASAEPPLISTSRWLRVEWRERPRGAWQQISHWLFAPPATWGQRVTSPLGVLALATLLLVGFGGYGVGAWGGTSTTAGSSSSGSSGMGGMNMGSSSDGTPASLPNATKTYSNEPAKYTTDADGAKHFSFTAQQVMWEPVKGHRVPAYTLDGTVPGPMMRVTVGDHVRITILNHLSEPTTIHFHGLEIPANQDGVPGVGQDPIQPGQTFTYDFTIRDNNVGTYFYHSHYNDLRQVSGGLYGAFIVDPRPGSPQAEHQPAHDQEYTEIISELQGYYVLNGKSFPDTQPITVHHGQKTLVRLINLGELLHPMHLHGHFFDVVADDGAPLAQPMRKDTLTISPGESYDFTFEAWAAPGSVYPFHCHILSHVMNPGMGQMEMGGLLTLVKYAQ